MACQVWSEKWVIFINRFHKPNRIIGNICLSFFFPSLCISRNVLRVQRCVARVYGPGHECMPFNTITIKVIIMIMMTHSLQADRWVNKQTSSLPSIQITVRHALGLNAIFLNHPIHLYWISGSFEVSWHFPKSFSDYHSSPIFNCHCYSKLRIDH